MPAMTPPPIVCAATPAVLIDVFRTSIDDRAARRFVRVLSTSDVQSRAAALVAIRTPLAPTTIAAIATARASKACSESIVTASQARMVAEINATWGVMDEADGQRLSDRLSVIADALFARDALGSATVDALLASFATSLAQLNARAPEPASPCTAPDVAARTLRVTMPDYPIAARAAHVTGTVQVKVELDDDGDVLSVVVYKDTVGEGVGADTLRRAAIVAAGTSDFAPAMQRCQTFGGAYIFRADFRGRR